MNKISPAVLPSLAVAVTVFVWAAAFPAIKIALREIDAVPLAAIRYSLAAGLAVAWLAWKHPRRMQSGDLLLCAACGVIGSGYSVLLNLGQQTVSAGAASFLIKTESLWMAVLAVLFLKERFSILAWAGTALCIVGVGLIASAQPGGTALNAGATFILAAACCTAISFTLQRRLVARYGALHVAAIFSLSAALTLSAWMSEAVAQLQAGSAVTFGWVVFLGIFPTTIGLICWAYALGYFGVARAGNFLYLVAPLATVMAWLVAAEAPRITTIAGGLLILSGVVVVNTRKRRQAVGEVASARPGIPAQSCVEGA